MTVGVGVTTVVGVGVGVRVRMIGMTTPVGRVVGAGGEVAVLTGLGVEDAAAVEASCARQTMRTAPTASALTRILLECSVLFISLRISVLSTVGIRDCSLSFS